MMRPKTIDRIVQSNLRFLRLEKSHEHFSMQLGLTTFGGGGSIFGGAVNSRNLESAYSTLGIGLSLCG